MSIPRHTDTFNRGSHCAIPWVEATALTATLNLLFQLHDTEFTRRALSTTTTRRLGRPLDQDTEKPPLHGAASCSIVVQLADWDCDPHAVAIVAMTAARIPPTVVLTPTPAPVVAVETQVEARAVVRPTAHSPAVAAALQTTAAEAVCGDIVRPPTVTVAAPAAIKSVLQRVFIGWELHGTDRGNSRGRLWFIDWY